MSYRRRPRNRFRQMESGRSRRRAPFEAVFERITWSFIDIWTLFTISKNFRYFFFGQQKSNLVANEANLTEDQQIIELQKMVEKLPKLNKRLLRDLVHFLKKMSAAADQSKMNSTNLGNSGNVTSNYKPLFLGQMYCLQRLKICLIFRMWTKYWSC